MTARTPLYLSVAPGTPVRRRGGGTAELRVGQTVSVWVDIFGNSDKDAEHLHMFADAAFVAVESDD